MISKKDDDMLLCDVCDQGFHTYCCDPPIKVPPKGNLKIVDGNIEK